jgi:hypothetical protein
MLAHFCSMCGPKFCSMLSQEMRDAARGQNGFGQSASGVNGGLSTAKIGAALAMKAQESKRGGGEIYRWRGAVLQAAPPLAGALSFDALYF